MTNPRRILVSLLCAVAGVLAFAAAPALAAPPIVPTVTIKPVGTVTTTTAKVSGTVNPNASPTVTLWNFQYSKEPATEGWTPSAVSGMALAAGVEEVKGTIEGLQPNATYEVRLVATNEEGGEGVSAEPNPKATTLPAPPAIVSESAPGPKEKEARLEALVNPNNQETKCSFVYGADPSLTTGTTTTSCETENGLGTVEGFNEGGDGVGLNVSGLSKETTYYYRAIVKNAKGEETKGAIQHFLTGPPEVPVTSEPVQDITATTATFEGTLNPNAAGEAEGSYEFVYRLNPTGCEGEGQLTTPGVGGLAGARGEAAKGEVSQASTGVVLEPNATYTVCLLARNSAGEPKTGNPVTFKTLPEKPAVETVSTPTVASDHATLEAVVNPENEPTTGCVFAYGETTAYGTEVACETPSIHGFGNQPMTAKITGLTKDTAYDYKVVVKTAAGESESAGKFVTNSVVAGPPQSDCPNPGHSGLSDRLQDCRAYELMTPVSKGDAEDMFGEGADPVGGVGDTAEGGYSDEDPAEEGDKFFFYTTAVFGEAPSSGQAGYVFSRTPNGWHETSLASRNHGQQSIESGGFFNPDFTDVVFKEKIGSLGDHAALREAGLFGPPGGPYTEPSLFSAFAHENADIKPVGASSDFSRVFFQSAAHLAGTAAVEQQPGSNALYEYTEGHYSLVNEKEGKTTSPCGAISPASEVAVSPYNHAVSSDGSRVFFVSPNPEHERCWEELAPTSFSGTPPQLYMRADGHTTVVSESQAGFVDPNGPQPVAFAGATADGSRVYFVTRAELTADDAGNDDPELYEYDVETGRLTRISSGDSHNAPGNVGWVIPSENGSTVYFTAGGQLAPGAPTLPNGGGEEGEYNLYRYDTKTASTTYITTVSGFDWFQDEPGGPISLNIRQPVNVRSDWETTSDGQFLLFAAVENITGYSTTDPAHCKGNIGGVGGSGGCAEVYRYDAANGSLVCVSCNPDGALPTASALFDNNTRVHQARAISNDGAYVFFDTSESLVPAATDELTNVYQWHEGEISLISSGQDSSPSDFIGTDASGQDVYFGTHSQLVAQDTDSAGDLYDARIGGGFPVSQGSAACEGDACQSPPPPPGEQTPASLTFTGAGNLSSQPPPGKTVAKKAVVVKCKRGLVRKKVKGKSVCVKAKKAKRASRRAGR